MEILQGKTPKVLIIEDDTDISGLLVVSLKARKYSTLTAFDGEDGLEKARMQGPDIILLDFDLPKKDGLEVCRTLKGEDATKYIPRVMLTARNDLKEQCFDAGADEFINKPFQQAELAARVRAMVRTKFLQDELLNINKHLSNLVSEKTKALESLYINTVTSLINAIEAKDSYTRHHSSRVAEYAELITRELGMNEQETSAIKEAAQLHDLGKIAIPDSILHKNGKLTPEEWEQIKKHPLASADILGRLMAVNTELESIKQHHERFDGSGYPYGNKNGGIPLGARIIAVADSYEAMTSDRSYRKALRREDAMEELVRNSGVQFDPRIVEIFLKALEKNGSGKTSRH